MSMTLKLNSFDPSFLTFSLPVPESIFYLYLKSKCIRSVDYVKGFIDTETKPAENVEYLEQSSIYKAQRSSHSQIIFIVLNPPSFFLSFSFTGKKDFQRNDRRVEVCSLIAPSGSVRNEKIETDISLVAHHSSAQRSPGRSAPPARDRSSSLFFLLFLLHRRRNHHYRRCPHRHHDSRSREEPRN